MSLQDSLKLLVLCVPAFACFGLGIYTQNTDFYGWFLFFGFLLLGIPLNTNYGK